MEQEHQPRPRFDPQAALEELERFGRDIQRYRAQREAVGEEFETFVRSFKTPPESVVYPPLVPPPVAAPAAPVERVEPQHRRVPEPEPVATREPEAPPEPRTVEQAEVLPTPPPSEPAAPPVPPVQRTRARTPFAALAGGALVLLIGAAALATFLWNRTPATQPAPAAAPESAAPPAAEPTPAPAVAAAPPPAAPAQRSTDSEIVTERQVWMRVIVDGNRVLEREVPAGARIPLKAEKTIVIRTGDAGAVRLSLRGAPGVPLGAEGEVVTRTFSFQPRPPERR